LLGDELALRTVFAYEDFGKMTIDDDTLMALAVEPV